MHASKAKIVKINKSYLNCPNELFFRWQTISLTFYNPGSHSCSILTFQITKIFFDMTTFQKLIINLLLNPACLKSEKEVTAYSSWFVYIVQSIPNYEPVKIKMLIIWNNSKSKTQRPELHCYIVLDPHDSSLTVGQKV